MKVHCPYCPATFQNQTRVDNHIIEAHPKEQPFHCEPCGKRFKVRGSYARHQREAHGGPPGSRGRQPKGAPAATDVMVDPATCEPAGAMADPMEADVTGASAAMLDDTESTTPGEEPPEVTATAAEIAESDSASQTPAPTPLDDADDMPLQKTRRRDMAAAPATPADPIDAPAAMLDDDDTPPKTSEPVAEIVESNSASPTPAPADDDDDDDDDDHMPLRRKKRRRTAVSAPPRSLATPADYRANLPPMDEDVPFLDWVRHARQYVLDADLSCPTLGDSTAHNVHNFAATLPPTWQEDVAAGSDVFDEFVDKLVAAYMLDDIHEKTLLNRIRYLRWLCLWRLTVDPRVDCDEVFPALDELIVARQRLSGIHHVQDGMLIMLDPYRLIELREQVLATLRRVQRETIDPAIRAVLQARSAETVDRRVAETLRTWIAAALQFADVPQRIQCTMKLELEPEGNDYVAKLVYDPVHRGYVRIINRDKTQRAHQPLRLTVNALLNAYLRFYLCLARRSQTTYVFPSTTGAGPWRSISADLKAFLALECPGLDPDHVFPNGRFIHASRHMALATFALQVNFEPFRLAALAKVMRHSTDVAARYYGLWQELFTAQRGADDFAQTMLHTETAPDQRQAPTTSNVLPPPSILQAWYAAQPELGLDKLTCYEYSMRSVGTSTTLDELCEAKGRLVEEEKKSIPETAPGAPLPICGHCQNPFRVHGPYGQKRDKKRFGRYFAQCLCCHPDKRPHLPTALWFPEGHVPATPSVSNHRDIS